MFHILRVDKKGKLLRLCLAILEAAVVKGRNNVVRARDDSTTYYKESWKHKGGEGQ